MFKPMLASAAPADLARLRYPLLASPKLDGIRCCLRPEGVMSRNLKPIPNRFIRASLARLPHGIDGELMVEGGFNACQSAIMSEAGEPDFFFFAFDWHDSRLPDAVFQDRLAYLTDWSEAEGHERLHVVEHVLVSNPDELQAYEERCVADGFEGTMIRDPMGPYKYGRATEKQGWLLKLKRFEDAEAVVVGAVERMHNENEQTRDELGRAKRSHAQAGKVGAGDLGALVCKCPAFAETFEVGTGFTAEQRLHYWEMYQGQGCGPSPIGRTITFKYQPHGTKDRPRSPVFKGFRHEDDQ